MTGSELLQRLGPADEPIESIGDMVGAEGALRVLEKSAWVAASSLDDSSDVEAHLSDLAARVQGATSAARLSRSDPIESMLRVIQYLPNSDWQGHGFIIDASWIATLFMLNGSLEVDQYVVADGEM